LWQAGYLYCLQRMMENGVRLETIETIHKIFTLVSYLAKTNPCSCLDNLEKEAMSGPTMGKCLFCKKKDTHSNFPSVLDAS
jgi:hypothetical protein